MFYTVYQVVNKINGKIYIGKHQTKDLEDGYMGSGKILRRAQEKYGVENFEKQILHVFETEEEMNLKEKELVTEEFCLLESTYNLCEGGKGGFGYINSSGIRNGFESRTDDSKTRTAILKSSARGRQTQKKLWLERGEWYDKNAKMRSDSVRKFIEENGHWWAGKTHTKESKQKIGLTNSILQSGSKNSQFGSMWITNGTENKKIKSIDIIPDGWHKGRVVIRKVKQIGDCSGLENRRA
jgi:hypothetical protein